MIKPPLIYSSSPNMRISFFFRSLPSSPLPEPGSDSSSRPNAASLVSPADISRDPIISPSRHWHLRLTANPVIPQSVKLHALRCRMSKTRFDSMTRVRQQTATLPEPPLETKAHIHQQGTEPLAVCHITVPAITNRGSNSAASTGFPGKSPPF